MKKTAAILVAICMMFTMTPVTAFAGEYASDEQTVAAAQSDLAQAEEPTQAEEPEVTEDPGEAEPEPEPVPEPEPEPEPVPDGWVKDANGDIFYYLEGACVTGRQQIDGNTFYFKSSGVMKTGWMKKNGKKYYFKATGALGQKGAMLTGLRNIKGSRYFFTSKGVMKTGPVNISGNLYYFTKSGKAVEKKGWFKGIDKKKRYSKGKGRIVTGTKKISGCWYRFSKKTGVMLQKIGDDVDLSAQKKTSKTKYLIIVKLKEHKVRIYKGKKGNRTRIHTYKCTTGASSTPTVKGTFTIKSRGLFFNTGISLRCWYYTQFYGNYLFHSVIYDRSSSPSHIMDGRLGISASHGCIRLALKNAKWIYKHIPSGTKVIIY